MELRFLLLAFLVGAALAGPFQRGADSRCAQECTPSSEKFSYEPGKKYVYNYKGTNYISVAGGRKQQESEITGKVEIHVKDQCEMALQLRDVRIRNPSEEDTQSLAEKLESYPLHFSWSDGEITDICPNPSESTVSLNIKRAILSAFVNTLPDFHSFSTYKETDSLGTCDTEYSSRGEYRGAIKVHKEKSLKSCDNRHSGFNGVIANPYRSEESDIRSLPLFTDEKLQCDQEIKDGVIEKVVCSERAKFKPSSNYSTFADFRGVISLSLEDVRGSSGIRHTSGMERKSILYSYSQDEQVEEKEREVKQILTQLCTETVNVINPSVSKLFYQLIHNVRFLSAEWIERIYMDLKSKKFCDSPKTLDIYLDCLPMAGTEGAIKLMVKLIREKEITGFKAKVWPASLALIPSPSAEAVAAVTPLLTGEERSGPVLLGVSAMIYRICSVRDCNRLQSVRLVVDHLYRILGDRCSSDNDEEVISVLKAFGNMGYIGDAKDSVIQCAVSSEKSVHVRLAAIDAFRRTQEKRPSEIIGLYSNPNEDYEVRIAALISAMKYPDEIVFNIVKTTMENEKHEQVAAFTQTFLKNLRQTSSPLKHEQRQLAESTEVRQHDVGYWENSKNIELSAFNTPLNLGGSIESNIIHARGSKLPRSGTAKIDIDFFGKNINLVEFGLRAEGLEKAIRKLLGMNEKTKKQTLQKSWFSRTLQRPQLSSESSKPDISFYLRTMDTEIFDFSAFDFTSVGNMVHFADILNKLSQRKQYDFAHSFMFVDTKIVVPSVTGRSYALSLAGSTTVGLSASGKFDAINLMSTPKNCDIEGRFQPSFNVELAATVGIQSENSRPDVKIVSSFHSASDIEAKFFVKDGHLLHARWNLPSEEIQLIKFSTTVYEIDSDNVERPLLDEMRTKVDHCTKSLVKPFGLEVCGKLQIPHPLVSRTFPFAKGFGNVELSLKKSDPSMEGFEVHFEIPKHKSSVMVYKAHFDTPGSSIRRKFSANLELQQSSERKEFKFDAESPFKSISSSGSFEKTPSQIKGIIQVTDDRSQRYSLKAVVETTSSGSEKTYKPFVQLIVPNSDPVTISGSVTHVIGRKQQLMIDLKSNKPSEKPIVLTGTLMKDGQVSLSKNAEWRVSSDLVAKSPWVSLKIRSAADKQSNHPNSISTSLSVDYQMGRSRKQAIRFSSKAQQKDSGKLSASAQFESTQMPSSNWLLSWDMQGKLREPMKNDIILRYGENPERSYIHLIQMSKPGDQTTLSEAKLLLTAPQFGVDSELQVAGYVDLKRSINVHVETDLRYTRDKHIMSMIKLQTISKKPLKMSLNAQLETPDKKMSYIDEIEETNPNEYSGNSIVQWNEGQQASLRYKYKRLSSRDSVHHEIESTLQTPSLSAPVKHKALVKLTSESFNLENRMKIGRNPTYFIIASVQRHGGPSELSLRVPKLEGNLKIQNDPQMKSASLDVKGSSISRHVIAEGKLTLGQKKALEGEIHFDADRNPSSKASFSSEVEMTSDRSRKSYSMVTELQYLDTINMKMESRGLKGVAGPHHFKMDVAGRSIEPITLNIDHEGSLSDIHSTLTFQQSHSEKAKLEFQGKMMERSSGMECSYGISLKSRDGSFEEKELTYSHMHTKTPSSISSKCNLRLQISPNKVYTCQIDLSNQPRQYIDLQMYLSTPHKRFEMQKLHISRSRSDSRYSVEATVEYGSSKKAMLAGVMDETRVGRSYSLSVTTPVPLIREAKYFISYENQRSKKQVESHFELNRKLMYEGGVSFEKQSRNTVVRSFFNTAATPELIAMVSSEYNGESYEHQLLVTKASRKLVFAQIAKQSSRKDVSYSIDIQDSEKSLFDVSLTKEFKGASTKYLAKAKGPFTPLSLTVQTLRSDEKSYSLSASLCKETPDRDCCNVRGYYKNEGSSSKYRQYQKITLDIERESGSSPVEHLCNVHYIFAHQERSLKSKLSVEAKGQKVGYDLQLNKQRSDDEPGSIDVSVSLPSRASRASVSFLRSPQSQSYAIEIVPDVSVSSKKMSASLKSEPQVGYPSHLREITGHISIDHQIWESPIQISFDLLKHPSHWPESAKVEVEYSRNPSDKLTAEMKHDPDRSQPERKSYSYRIYSADKDIDLIITVVKESHDSEHPFRQYGWHWIWHPDTAPRTGGFLITLSHDPSSSIPCTTNVTYYSPSSSLTLLGHTLWEEKLPAVSKWKFVSSNELLAEAEFHREGQCYDIQIIQSDPVWKSRVCFENVDESGKKHLSVECYHYGEKCVDVTADFNPYLPMISNINAHWKQDQLILATRSVKNMSPSLTDPELEAVEYEIKEKVHRVGMSLKRKVWRPLKSHMESEISNMVESQKEKIRHLKNFVRRILPSWEELRTKYVSPFVESVEEKIREAEEYIKRNAPEELKEPWEDFKEILEKYRDEYCSSGSFCYQVRLAYRRRGMKQVQVLMQQKALDVAKSSSRKLREVVTWAHPYVETFRRYIDSTASHVGNVLSSFGIRFDVFERFRDRMQEAGRKVVDKFRRYYEEIRQKITDAIDNASDNEDVQVISQLMMEAKNEVMKQWMQTDFKKMMKPVPQAFLEAVLPHQWLNEKLTIKSDFKNGTFQLQMNQPIGRSKMVMLKNTFIFLKNKLQQSRA